MPLAAGARLGHYEILATLGAGGMGEVYKARDVRLHRIVAIKALHDLFADHPERIARFDREAQLLASLNHPNIAAIHGVEEVQGAKYLVLEFVDGRSLSAVLRDGPLPVAQAIALARQIVEALAAAHERGIVHRDLKPANVMITPDDRVKLLDFGLAKAMQSDSEAGTPGGSTPANSPTMTMAATQAGIILGTAGYMSPEQAKGRPADKRSDVWAVGCVLFEMLTGRRAFEGEDVTETLAAIVRGEPDWTKLPADTPPTIRTLIERCLIKDKTQRIADMSVVRYLLAEHATLAPASGAAPLPAPASRARSISLPIAAGIVLLAIAATVAVIRIWAPVAAPAAGPTHVSLLLPPGDEVGDLNELPLAVSPDGRLVAYEALRSGKAQLFVRALADAEPKEIAGTDGARSPFFSPNGQWIGFFALGKLKRVTVGGTALQVMADAPDARGGTWADDDTIYFAPTNTSGIWKTPASGGAAATQITQPDPARGEISHRWPHALPGGKDLLFNVWTGPGLDERHIVRQSLAPGGARTLLISGGDNPRYLSAGYLMYGRLDALYALPWTPADTAPRSGVVPFALPENPRGENEGASDFGLSIDGTLAYLRGDPGRRAHRLVWVDRTGKAEPLPVPDRDYRSVIISPDGRQAMTQILEGTEGLWLYDFARQALVPFAAGNGSSQAPVWSSDGKRVIYRSTRNGFRNLFAKAADGTGEEERLTSKPDVVQTPTSVSPDGHWLLFNEAAVSGTGIWVLRLDGDHAVRPLMKALAGELDGLISPDGKWVAFASGVSGRSEVYVQPFPGPGPRQPISTTGGNFPRWSRDGRELFYTTLDQLMAVDVTLGSTFAAGPPHVLYTGRYRISINSNTPYDVSLDGRRTLRVQQVQLDRAVTSIDLVLNWVAELKRVAAK